VTAPALRRRQPTAKRRPSGAWSPERSRRSAGTHNLAKRTALLQGGGLISTPAGGQWRRSTGRVSLERECGLRPGTSRKGAVVKTRPVASRSTMKTTSPDTVSPEASAPFEQVFRPGESWRIQESRTCRRAFQCKLSSVTVQLARPRPGTWRRRRPSRTARCARASDSCRRGSRTRVGRPDEVVHLDFDASGCQGLTGPAGPWDQAPEKSGIVVTGEKEGHSAVGTAGTAGIAGRKPEASQARSPATHKSSTARLRVRIVMPPPATIASDGLTVNGHHGLPVGS
jgi:hypothetical protein